MKRRVLVAMLLVASVAQGYRGRKSFGSMVRIPDQKVEIASLVKSLDVEHRKCENYAWAAIVDAMMQAQKVKIKQETWAEQTSDGMKCFPALDDYAKRAAALNGDYALDGGVKVRIAADYEPGVPQPDAMIYSLKMGRPLMVVWKGRPYLLYGLMYDEWRHSSGKSKQFVIRGMKLLDAAIAVDKPGRKVSLTKDAGQLEQVSGYMSVTVTPREWYELPK